MRAEDLLGARQLGQLVEDAQQVVALVGLLGLAQVQFPLVAGLLEPLAGPGDLGRVDEPVVLQEPHEDAGEHPGRRRLRDRIAPPVLVVLRRPLGLLRPLVLLAQPLAHLRHLGRLAPLEQVGFEPLEQLLQVGEQGLAVDHGCFDSVAVAAVHVLEPTLRDTGPLAWAEQRDRLAVDQGLVVARQEQPQARDAVAAADLLRKPAEQVHLVVAGQDAGIDQEHRPLGREQPLLDGRHGAADQHHQLVPVAALWVGVGLEHQVPVDPGLAGDGLQGIQEHALHIHQFDREPPADLLAGTIVELRIDQQAQERAFADRPLEPFLELPGFGLLGRDLAGLGPARCRRVARCGLRAAGDGD